MAESFRHGDSWWAWTCLNYPTSVSKFRGMHFCIKFCKICIAALSDDDRRPVPRVCRTCSRFSVDYLLALFLGLKHFAPLMLESRVLSWEGVGFEREPLTQMVTRWFAPVLGLFPHLSLLNTAVSPGSSGTLAVWPPLEISFTLQGN